MRRRLDRTAMVLVALLWVGTAPSAQAAKGKASQPEPGMALRGDQEGTAFRSLTVEGEDRVHFEIERPSLDLAIDPAKAPGLDWGDAHDVLDREAPDGVAPFLAGSTAALPRTLGRPWLRLFASGDVARFRPQVDNVASWRLLVADSRGNEVASFEGRGKPPREIAWDGRAKSGAPAPPGLTYSYVLEARDKAGNKRNFVGAGFELPAYRLQGREGQTLAFAGGAAQPARPGVAAPLVLEAASWLNQVPLPQPLSITATARSYERANALATGVASSLAPLLLGDPARLKVQARVEPDAGEAGAVEIVPGR